MRFSLFLLIANLSQYTVFLRSLKSKQNSSIEKGSAYKDVHKRVKRLVNLKLIDQIKEYFERGAKHYKITPYGLITYLDKDLSDDNTYILYNKENTVIQSLLFEFLEEETIDSLGSSRKFRTKDIEDYLHDCCSTTTDICKEFCTKIKRYNIRNILPNDDAIQKYMSYLDGKPIDYHILDEIKEYEKRLMSRLDVDDSDNKELVSAVDKYNEKHFSPDAIRHYKKYKSVKPYNRNYLDERPPFPLLDIYYDIICDLRIRLEQKRKLLAFNIVSTLGDTVITFKIESQDRLKKFLEGGRDYSLRHIMKDRRFFELVTVVKNEFDIGYKQFPYYH